MTTRRKSAAIKLLEDLAGGPQTFGKLLWAIREGEEETQSAFATKLGISRSHLCDIEKGRKTVTPARAAKFAKQLGYGEARFVELALQGMLEEAGLKLTVRVEA